MPDVPESGASHKVGITTRLTDLGRTLMDLLYPPRCTGCGRVGALFCDVCQSQVELIGASVCRRCGRPTPGRDGLTAAERELCAVCRRTPSSLDGIVAVAVFAQPLREAIHSLKYNDSRRLAQPLGSQMAATWREIGPPADIIISVPLHADRLTERGYNQSDLLAAVLSEKTGLPLDTRLLTRSRATQPQVKLGVHERRQNVAGAFHCPYEVAGKRLVLIDDVCTTGATLEACATALRAGGARAVWGFTLARARWQPDVTTF